MPIYEFTCGDGRRRIEVLVISGGNRTYRCPEGGSRYLQKHFSRFGTCGNSRTVGSPRCAGCSSGNCDSCG